MENRKETLARVLRFAKPYRWYLLAALVSAVLSVSLTLYAPVLIGRGIDQIIAPGKVYFDNLLPILIELGIVAVLAALFQWLLTLCTNIVTYKTVRDLRSAAFEHMEELPLSNIDSRPHGDIISRIINDIDSVSDGLLQGFSQLFTGIITIAITLVYMLAINFKVGLVVVIITPLSLFVASFIAKHSFDMFRRQSAIKGQLSGCIEELVGKGRAEAEAAYDLWQITSFSATELAMEQTVEIYCPEHQVLMPDASGVLCIFENRYGDALALVRSLDTPLSSLPESLQEELRQGKGFDSVEELERWLENAES